MSWRARRACRLLGLVLALSLMLGASRAFADMTVSTYMSARASGDTGQQNLLLAYLAGVLDGLNKANESATTAGAPLFCQPQGADQLQPQPLQTLVDNFIKFSTRTQPSFAASAKEVSVGSVTLIVLTNLYPCPSKGDGKG